MAFVVKRLFADELYFNKALSVYAYNDIPFSFKWVGYIGGNGQEENTGKDALNKAVQFLIGRNCNLRRTAATGAFASGHPAEPNGHLH